MIIVERKPPGWYYTIKTALETGYSVDLETGNVRGKDGRILKASKRPPGKYRKVSLCLPGGRKPTVPVYKIVAFALWRDEAFAKGVEVRHLDSNHENDHPSNLALGTRTDNINDRPIEVRRRCWQVGLSKLMGQPNVGRKLSDEQVLEVVRRRRLGARVVDLAREFGVNGAVISRIMSGRQYPSVTKGVLQSSS